MGDLTFGQTVGAGVISGAANTLFSGLAGIFNSGQAERAATKQYERQVDFWKMQNEYNKPINQRKRIEEAGLNPALMYSGGNFNNDAGSLSEVPGNEYAQRGVLPSGFGTGFLDQAIKLATIKNIQADTADKSADAQSKTQMLPYQLEAEKWLGELRRKQGIGQDIANKIADVEFYIADASKDFRVGITAQELANKQAEWDKAMSDVRLIQAQALNQEIKNEYERARQEQELANLYQSMLETQARISYYQAGATLAYEQSETERQTRTGKVAEISARVDLMKADNERKAQMFAKELQMADIKIKGMKFDNSGIVKGIKLALDAGKCACDIAAMFYTGGLSSVARSAAQGTQPSSVLTPTSPAGYTLNPAGGLVRF